MGNSHEPAKAPSHQAAASIVVTGGGGMLAAAITREAQRRGINAIAMRRDECDISVDTDRRKLFELH